MRYGRQLRGVMLALAVTVASGGCASWAIDPGELERAGGTVYSQVQVMRLVADTALRDNPPTVSLQVMLDDAEKALSEQERKLAEMRVTDVRKAALLEAARRVQTLIDPLRAAVDAGDHAKLRALRRQLTPSWHRIESLGLA